MEEGGKHKERLQHFIKVINAGGKWVTDRVRGLGHHAHKAPTCRCEKVISKQVPVVTKLFSKRAANQFIRFLK